MAELVDKRTGETVQVADDQIGDMIASGEAANFTISADQAVQVRDTETGAVKTTSAKDLGTALGGGFEIATRAHIEEHRKQQEFGEGVGNAVQTTAEAAFNSATLGAGDAILTGFGADPEAIEERRARNEVSSIVGTGVGLLAPALVSGGALAPVSGASTAARAGSAARLGLQATPTALAARAGRVATEKIAEKFGGGLLARAGGTAATGAGEGALFGAGQALSNVALDAESALGDQETVAEYVWANAKEGALLGAVAGGGLTVGGAAVGGAARKLTDTTRKAFGKAISRETVDEALDGFAFSAVRGRKKFAESADRYLKNGGAKRAGRIFREEIDFAPSDTVQSLGAKMQTRLQVHKETARQLVAQADEAADAALSTRAVMERVERDVIEPLRKRGAGATSQRVARRVEREINEVLGITELKKLQQKRAAVMAKAVRLDDGAERAGLFSQADDLGRQIDDASSVSLTELRNRRIAFENDVRLNRKSNTPEADAMLDARNSIEAEIMDGVESAGLIDDFKNAKERISAFSVGVEAAEDTINRDQVNRFLSLSDMQSFQVGALADVAIGGAFDVGTMGMGLLMGTANKLIREHGSSAVVSLGNRIGGLRKLQGTAQTVEKSVESATSGIVSLLKSGAKGAKSGAPIAAAALGSRDDKYKAYQEKRDAVARMQAEPEIMATRVQPLQVDGAPNVGTATAATAARAVNFLAEKAPRQRPGSLVRSDLDKTRRVSDAEVNKFLRYARAVEEPLSVLKDAERGDVTREGVEALRAVYPKMYGRLVENVTEALGELSEPPPMAALQQMSIVLGQPLHFTMRPAFIQAHQQMFAQRRESVSKARPPSNRAAPKSAGSLQTPSQRIEGAAGA